MKTIIPDDCYIGCDDKVYDVNDPFKTGQWEMSKESIETRVWVWDSDYNLFYETDNEELEEIERIIQQHLG